jgi:hypothetical protein
LAFVKTCWKLWLFFASWLEVRTHCPGIWQVWKSSFWVEQEIQLVQRLVLWDEFSTLDELVGEVVAA